MPRVRPRLHLLVVSLLVVGLVAPTGVVGSTDEDTLRAIDPGPGSSEPAGVSGPSNPASGNAHIVGSGGIEDVGAAGAGGWPTLPPGPNESNASAGVGRQLATVVAAAGDDVGADVEETAFESAYGHAQGSERAELLADRAEELVDRAAAVRNEYADLVESYREGDVSESTYGFRIALLNSRARNLRENIEGVQSRARNVSTGALREAGLEPSTLSAARRALEIVTGPGPSAVFNRFTGELPEGTDLDIEASGAGYSITVERGEGDRSREFDAIRDPNGSISVSESEALATARAALTAVDGEWVLRRSRVRRDEGYYGFEFELRGNATGEAEVSVDGSTGRVFHLEEEIDSGEGEQEESRNPESRLELVLVEGTPAPGETVQVRVLADGKPAANATVFVDGVRVGTTGSNGTLEVTLPSEGPKIEAEYDDAEAELEFDFDSEDASNPSVESTYDAGTVTVTVTRDGRAVAGVVVEANGNAVGRTDAAGAITFTIEADAEALDLELRHGDAVIEREYLIRNRTLVRKDG